MRSVTVLVLFMVAIALALPSCNLGEPERVLKAPGSDVNMVITRGNAASPDIYEIRAVLPDGSTSDTAVLTRTSKDVLGRFSRLDTKPYVLILAGSGKRTLWIVYSKSGGKFLSPQDLQLMTSVAVQNQLTIRDESTLQ